MNEFRADLHTHTNCSDGTESPEQVLKLAKAAGLSGISITDHDTAQAYTDEFFASAKELGLEVLLGTEISSELEGITVHILAYAFGQELFVFLKEVQKKRIERNRKILESLRKKGIVIDEAQLRTAGPMQIIGRPHIAQVMVRLGAVASVQDAFNFYLKDGASCYAPGGKFSPREVVAKIHEAKGKAVLAHPHFLKRGRFLRELLELPFDGIECYYSRLSKEQEAPWVQIAKERKWIATGGSEYHGANRSNVPLGASWVGLETFSSLKRSS